MDPAVLVEPDIKAGEDLLIELDRRDLGVDAALWWFDGELREWRLLIASSRVEEPGPSWFLKQVLDALKDLGSRLRLRDVEVHSPRDPEIRLFRGVLSTGGEGIEGVRFSRNMVNGAFVEDAYIYRLP